MLQIEISLDELREMSEDDPVVALVAARAARRSAEYVQSIWQLVAEGFVVPGMSRGFFDPKYAASIQTMVSPYHVDVYTNYAGALTIQSGRPPVDLKPGLLNGPSAKRAQDGHRYTIVPLRHATPGNSGQHMLPALPYDVYRAARLGQNITPQSEMGQRGRRETWVVGPYAGLRREVAPGMRKGTYWTYRTVSDHTEPSKWVLPALPPMDVRQAVWDYCKVRVEEIIQEELRR